MKRHAWTSSHLGYNISTVGPQVTFETILEPLSCVVKDQNEERVDRRKSPRRSLARDEQMVVPGITSATIEPPAIGATAVVVCRWL